MNMHANSSPGVLSTAWTPRGEIRLAGARCTRSRVAARISLAGQSAAAHAAPLLASMAGLAVLPSVFARAIGLI